MPFQRNHSLSLFMAWSFLRQLICDQQQEEEGLSVMTNVYVSSPKNAASFCLHRAQKVAAQHVSTLVCQSRTAVFLHRSHFAAHCTLVRRPGAQKISMAFLTKHTNTGQCPDLSTVRVKSGTLAQSHRFYPAPKEAHHV